MIVDQSVVGSHSVCWKAGVGRSDAGTGRCQGCRSAVDRQTGPGNVLLATAAVELFVCSRVQMLRTQYNVGAMRSEEERWVRCLRVRCLRGARYLTRGKGLGSRGGEGTASCEQTPSRHFRHSMAFQKPHGLSDHARRLFLIRHVPQAWPLPAPSSFQASGLSRPRLDDGSSATAFTCQSVHRVPHLKPRPGSAPSRQFVAQSTRLLIAVR